MTKRVLFTLFSLLLLLALAACGGGEANTQPGGQETTASPGTPDVNEEDATGDDQVLTITHQLGETKVPYQPERVVVFDFGVLDSLDKLGVEVTGVPQMSIPPYLSKYADSAYENVGSLREADFEKISEIDPDLIIISGRMSESYDELSKLGATIFLGVDNTRYMESYKENARVLGQIFGKEDEVEQEIAEVEALIAEIKEKVVSSGSNALVILANEGNISAYGVGSRFGMIYDVAGFIPVDENIEVSTHGMSVSFEYIVEMDPDYLFVVDRGAVVGDGESSAQQLIENELVERTRAYQEGNIVYLDPNYWYMSGGGLISVAEMMKELEQALQ